MTEGTGSKSKGLLAASLFWATAGIISICPAIFFVVFFDTTASGKGLGDLDSVLIVLAVSFPIISIGSSIIIWTAKNSNRKLAVYAALFAAAAIVLFLGMISTINWVNCGAISCKGASLMKNQGSTIEAGACETPILDGGDGLEPNSAVNLLLG